MGDQVWGLQPTEQLMHFLRRCGDIAVLVAPYMKVAAFTRLLDCVPARVPVWVYTRWSPVDVALGSTDLEVFDHAQSRGNVRFKLVSALHAKYYRSDDRVFFGSANLTDRGLGWSQVSNLEILFDTEWSDQWAAFERLLEDESVFATTDAQQAIRRVATSIDVAASVHDRESQTLGRASEQTATEWIPRCRSPESVVLAYRGRTDVVSTAALSDALVDLEQLQVPNGLDEGQCLLWIRGALTTSRFLQLLDELIVDRPRFGDLRERFGTRFQRSLRGQDPTEALQVAMRWCIHFLPDRYRIRVYRFSEHLELRGDIASSKGDG